MPYSRKAKYRHIKVNDSKMFIRNSFKTVPIEHTEYKGKKYAKKGNMAIVGKLRPMYKKRRAWAIVTILDKK